MAAPEAVPLTTQLEHFVSMGGDGHLSEQEFEEAKRKLLWK
jgi:hypothetical protein